MIAIVIDTNIINSGSKNYMVAQFSNKLDDIIRALESSDNYQDIKILLPQIVVKELYQHQLANYNKEVERLKGLKPAYNAGRMNIKQHKTIIHKHISETTRWKVFGNA